MNLQLDNDRGRLLTVRADGTEYRELHGPFPQRSTGTPYNIDLSPDGSRILFGAGTVPTFELWAIENITALLNAKR